MSALRAFASPVAASLYDEVNAAHASDQLDAVVRKLWLAFGEGAVSEEEIEFLVSCAERRRPRGSATAPGFHNPVGRLAGRVGSRFIPRQRQRSPDRQASRDRRRRLGGSSALPDTLRHHYTEGQRAVLCILAGEIKRRGICDLPIDKIAALAGVCRTTVQTAMHEARRLGHIRITERPVRGRKNLPNMIAITSAEWIAWIKRGPLAHGRIGSNPLNLVNPTKSKELKNAALSDGKRQQGADRDVPWGSSAAKQKAQGHTGQLGATKAGPSHA